MTIKNLEKPNIIISGKFCSGKTSLAEYLCSSHKYTKVAFADKLKEVVADIYSPFIEDKSVKQRDLLQMTGHAIREVSQVVFNRSDVWAAYLSDKLKHTSPQKRPFVIDDCRYQDELDTFLKDKWISIRIESPENVRINRYRALYNKIPTNDQIFHQSETSLDGADFHFVIENQGSLIDLYKEIDKVLSTIDEDTSVKTRW